jgi:hypothetical protein
MATAPGRVIDHLKIELPARDISTLSHPRFAEYHHHIDSAIGSVELEHAI